MASYASVCHHGWSTQAVWIKNTVDKIVFKYIYFIVKRFTPHNIYTILLSHNDLMVGRTRHKKVLHGFYLLLPQLPLDPLFSLAQLLLSGSVIQVL